MKYLLFSIITTVFAFHAVAQDTIKAAKSEVRTYVQQMPEYPGGDKALFKFLSDNIHYPTEAREKNISGTVLLEFTVSDNGHIIDVKPLREVAGGCTEEAIRVIKLMPVWKPGVQDGKAVSVYYHLPVTFQLSEEGGKKKKKDK